MLFPPGLSSKKLWEGACVRACGIARNVGADSMLVSGFSRVKEKGEFISAAEDKKVSGPF